MRKGILFFCCSCAILLFTIINLSIGPIVSGKVGYDETPDGKDFSRGTANCKYYNDYYNEAKKESKGDELKYGAEWVKNECRMKKGMYDMEYTSFIFNIVIGFVCALLGLLHLFDIKKEMVPRTGLIGLGCGFVGLVLSFIYVIFNGIVYTKYHDYDDGIFKRDKDSSFAVRESSGVFKCIYFEDNNPHSVYATYSELGNKKYNYDKDLIKSFNDDCAVGYLNFESYSSGKIDFDELPNYGISIPTSCTKLFIKPETRIINKGKSDRFLTALILSLFVCLANLGLALFGFLLYRTPSEF